MAERGSIRMYLSVYVLFQTGLLDGSAPILDIWQLCIIVNPGVSVGSATCKRSTEVHMMAFGCDLEFTVAERTVGCCYREIIDWYWNSEIIW